MPETWSRIDKQLFSIIGRDDRFQVPDTVDNSRLATGLHEDTSIVVEYFLSEDPGELTRLSHPVTLQERYNALIGYFHLMQGATNISEPVGTRASIVNQLYFDLVYFREALLRRLSALVGDRFSPEKQLPYLHQFLRLVENDAFACQIRDFRNAFAHGNWAYSANYSALVIYPRKDRADRLEISDSEVELIHALIYGFFAVFFTVLHEHKVVV